MRTLNVTASVLLVIGFLFGAAGDPPSMVFFGCLAALVGMVRFSIWARRNPMDREDATSDAISEDEWHNAIR